MPRYFFHIHHDAAVECDLLGSEFSSLDAAIKDAAQARLEIMRDEGWNHCIIEVVDEQGRVVVALPPDEML